MSGYLEGVLVILLLNVIFAYAVSTGRWRGPAQPGGGRVRRRRRLRFRVRQQRIRVSPWLACIGAGMVTFVLALIIAVPCCGPGASTSLWPRSPSARCCNPCFSTSRWWAGRRANPVLAYLGIAASRSSPSPCFSSPAFLERTRFGLNMVAVHDDEAVSDLFGINVRRYQALAFAIGAAFAGLGGGLVRAPLQLHRAPELFENPVQHLRGPVRPPRRHPRPCSVRCSAPSSSPCCRRCCAAARSGATRSSRS